MEELLHRAFFVPDQAVVKAAGLELTKHLKHSSCISELHKILQTSDDSPHRQIAAIVMKKVITRHWTRLSEDEKTGLKAHLLQLLFSVDSELVRQAITDVVGLIARFTVSFKQWPELLPCVYKFATSAGNPSHRKAALDVLEVMGLHVSEVLKADFSKWQQVLLATLQDSDAGVRCSAIKTTIAFRGLSTHDEEIAGVLELVKAVICQVIQQENVTEDIIQNAFELFEDVITLDEISPLVPDLLRFSLKIAANQHVDTFIRQHAILLIQEACDSKRKTVMMSGLMEPIADIAFALCHEGASLDAQQISEELWNSAGCMMDVMATSLPGSKIFKLYGERIAKYLNSSDANARRTAFLAITVCAEACYECCHDSLDQLVPVLCRGLQDSDPLVCETACVAVGQFSTHVTDFERAHGVILPLLFNLLDKDSKDVKGKAMYALSEICENLERDDIGKYISPLMEKCISLLDAESLRIREMAMICISSIASAAEEDFLPFFQAAAEKILHLTRNPPPDIKKEGVDVRGRSIEALGMIAVAIGAEPFRPLLDPLMQLIVGYINTAQTDDFEMRELCYGFFGNVSSVYGSEFGPYLSTCVPLLLKSCLSDDGIILKQEESAMTAILGEDDEDIGEDVNFSIRTSFFEEKAGAVFSLGVLAEHTGAAFHPFVEQVLSTLGQIAKYFHHDVRLKCITALQKIVCALKEPTSESPMIGAPPQAPSENVQEAIRFFLNIIFERFEDEEEVVVTECFRSCSALLKEFGSWLLLANQDIASLLVKYTVMVFERKASCQLVVESMELDEDDNLELYDGAMDIVGDISATLPPDHFGEYFKTFFPFIYHYSSVQIPEAYRTLALGTLGYWIAHIKERIQQVKQQVYQVAMAGLQGSSALLKGNAAYTIGLLCQYGGQELQGEYTKILMALHPVFSIDSCKDNACGAVARMICGCHEKVPLQEVLPVLFANLPLRSDFEPYIPILHANFMLLKMSHPAITPHIDAVFKLFANAFDVVEGPEADSVKAEIIHLTSSFSKQYQQQFSRIVNSLSSEEAEQIQAILALA